jgi:alpha-N-acetylglucosaminidase
MVQGKNTKLSEVSIARAMTERLIPAQSANIVYKQIVTDVDSFLIESSGDKVCISGNNANSMAMGLNYYLQNYCLTTVSWFACDPIDMPSHLPRVESPVGARAKVKARFFLNYCTYGYTMPFWNWTEWERFIDWMALNGVNMPLAITGQESIWYNVWKKLGLKDDEIRNYFTGPAHLPWHRMSNIDGWQGPLPKSWLENQKNLQKRIVERERELGMTPVLPAFAGHIPGALRRLYPDLKATDVSRWAGFEKKYSCTFLNPLDPLFPKIQKAYLQEQTRLYGTDHIYGVDPFNEVDPPTSKEDSLSIISRMIYESLTSVDKEARWLQMGWLFHYDAAHWTQPRVKALLRGVPQDKLIMLDYFCDANEVWKKTESFYGQPFIWCYLGNFGGNIHLNADFDGLSSKIKNTFSQDSTGNFFGIGSTLEGFDVNQCAFEFVLGKAWNLPVSDDEWILRLADRRYGEVNAQVRDARSLLRWHAPEGDCSAVTQNPVLKSQNFTFMKEKSCMLELQALRKLLSVPNTGRDAYVFDVVNLGRDLLGWKFREARDRLIDAYEAKNLKDAECYAGLMRDLLCDVDALLACHSTFSLESWIEKARKFGTTSDEADYYEENARTLITVWGGSLLDYARRDWCGLVSTYYAPRWENFMNEIISAIKENRQYDGGKVGEQNKTLNWNFIKPSTPVHYSPKQDGVKLCKQLIKKYFGDE